MESILGTLKGKQGTMHTHIIPRGSLMQPIHLHL